ncbi:transcriptional regulator [Streptomyces sp. NRRL B-24484]|uniref:transcriptional regulator n=1 Tax=Streptomyces sp. NRRL B-24484 TaxID=1463833 RepID=UPI0004C00C5F|nr:transcriptional regulator [Streptomyces sp. NRRL B-24484]
MDPEKGPVEAFAAELRRIRDGAGEPPYREMAKKAHLAYNTLSEADKGVALPTLTTVLAYARACAAGPDTVAALQEQWHQAQARLRAAAGTPLPDRPAPDPTAIPATATPPAHPADPGPWDVPGTAGARTPVADDRQEHAAGREPNAPAAQPDPARHSHQAEHVPLPPHGANTDTPAPDSAAPEPADTAGSGNPGTAASGGTQPDAEDGRPTAGTEAGPDQAHTPQGRHPAPGNPAEAGTTARQESVPNGPDPASGPAAPPVPVAGTDPAGPPAAADGTEPHEDQAPPPATTTHRNAACGAVPPRKQAPRGRGTTPLVSSAEAAETATAAAVGEPTMPTADAPPTPSRDSSPQSGDRRTNTDLPESRPLPAATRTRRPRTAMAIATVAALVAGTVAAAVVLTSGTLHRDRGATALPSPGQTATRTGTGTGTGTGNPTAPAPTPATDTSLPNGAPPPNGAAATAGTENPYDYTPPPGTAIPIPTVSRTPTTAPTSPRPAPDGAAPPAGPSDIPNEERNVTLNATQPGYRSVGIDYWGQQLDNPNSNPNGDLWITTDHLYTTNGAAVAPIETTPDATRTRCTSATTWTTRIDLTALHTGDQLCAHSTEGRYAVIRITALPATGPSGNLVFHGLVWKNPL